MNLNIDNESHRLQYMLIDEAMALKPCANGFCKRLLQLLPLIDVDDDDRHGGGGASLSTQPCRPPLSLLARYIVASIFAVKIVGICCQAAK